MTEMLTIVSPNKNYLSFRLQQNAWKNSGNLHRYPDVKRCGEISYITHDITCGEYGQAEKVATLQWLPISPAEPVRYVSVCRPSDRLSSTVIIFVDENIYIFFFLPKLVLLQFLFPMKCFMAPSCGGPRKITLGWRFLKIIVLKSPTASIWFSIVSHAEIKKKYLNRSERRGKVWV